MRVYSVLPPSSCVCVCVFSQVAFGRSRSTAISVRIYKKRWEGKKNNFFGLPDTKYVFFPTRGLLRVLIRIGEMKVQFRNCTRAYNASSISRKRGWSSVFGRNPVRICTRVCR